MKRMVKVAALAIVVLTLSAPAFAKGNLVVYAPNSDGEIQGILYPFGDKYDVKISLQSMGTGECVSKITADKANPQADAMFGGVNMGVYQGEYVVGLTYEAPSVALLVD